MLGTSENGCGLLGVSVGLKTPDRWVHRDDFRVIILVYDPPPQRTFYHKPTTAT